MRLRGMWWVGVLIAVVVLALGTGIGFALNNAAREAAAKRAHDRRVAVEQAEARRIAQMQAALTAGVKLVPTRNSTNVPLDAPIVVASKAGKLSGVRVTASGWPVAGAYRASKHWWQAHSTLLPGATYTLTANVTGPAGVSAKVSSSFTTLTPTQFVDASIYPGTGSTVGIAQPIVVHFTQPVPSAAARAEVLHHFTVSDAHHVPGGWHWFSDTELHFRPRLYWPAGDHVSVTAQLDGWNAGDGRWGATGQHHVEFTIGDAHVSVANLATHFMTVTSNGQIVANYPMSGGREQYPTMNGTHIVMDIEPVVHMVSSTNGIPVNSPDGYDEYVYADVHISDSGEYVHAAPWSVGSQGRTNVSHGCINLSPADANAFMGFSRVGDVVQVIGGPRPPETGDHGVMDWSTDWSQWTPA